ncbi:MAG: hypothetical protein ACE5G2_02540 [Candidatus Krumholzibacteriia bacterium]
MTRLIATCVAACVLASLRPSRVLAQVELGGFVQANYAARTTGSHSSSAADFPLGEERLQLKLEGYSEDGSAAFLGKVDLLHDAVSNETGVDLREAYLDLVSDNITFRAGRQILTWGVGDLLFLNDIFPKDWVAFFTGRPLQYLKVGTDALRVDFYPGPLTAEIVVAPFFQPDRYPSGERLVLTTALPPGIVRREEKKTQSFENVEISAKTSLYIADWEAAAYGSRTFHRSPATGLDDPDAPTQAHLFFPRLNVYGGSISGGFLGGVLSLEGAYYDSKEDREGTHPAIENSQVKGLIGYSYPVWEDATVGLQGFLEWRLDHGVSRASLPPGNPERDQHRWTATTRFTQRLLHHTLSLNFFAFWGATEQDAYLIPSVRYSFTDELWAEIGANVFLANEPHTMFGVLDENDNAYLTMRHGF